MCNNGSLLLIGSVSIPRLFIYPLSASFLQGGSHNSRVHTAPRVLCQKDCMPLLFALDLYIVAARRHDPVFQVRCHFPLPWADCDVDRHGKKMICISSVVRSVYLFWCLLLRVE